MVKIAVETGRMVLGTFGNDWLVRLEKLRAMRGEFPDGPQWLWNIRIRILEFLVARYSDGQAVHESACDEKAASDALNSHDRDSEWAWPSLSMHRTAMTGIEHPPRSREQMAAALDRLEQAHDLSASARWRSRKPEQAWEWWRDTYACR